MLQTTTQIREDITGDVASREYAETDLVLAKNNFWHFRVLMNPRLALKGMWFPRSLATKLRAFHEDFKAGKRPVMLLCTPPQHGKSLSVIDFVAWNVGHDPELRVIYSSFSDRLGIRANLRLQRAIDSAVYRKSFPDTRLSSKHIVTIAERYLRNHEVLEFVGHEGYFRNTTVLGAITGEALDISVIDDPSEGRKLYTEASGRSSRRSLITSRWRPLRPRLRNSFPSWRCELRPRGRFRSGNHSSHSRACGIFGQSSWPTSVISPLHSPIAAELLRHGEPARSRLLIRAHPGREHTHRPHVHDRTLGGVLE